MKRFWEKTSQCRKKVAEVAGKAKNYVVKETRMFYDFLASNEAGYDEILKGQKSIKMDYTIFEATWFEKEPVEGVPQKAIRLWKSLFGDKYFIFQRVKRHIRKNKNTSKRSICALDEEQLLEMLLLALEAGNTEFILKAFELRGIPESFVWTGLRSGHLDIIKMIASKSPERATSQWVLIRLAEAREFELCRKILEHIEHLGKECNLFVNQLILRKDVNDYEGWKILDELLKKKKIEYYTLKVLFLEVAKLGYWLSFKKWRTSCRSATFLFIYFMV